MGITKINFDGSVNIKENLFDLKNLPSEYIVRGTSYEKNLRGGDTVRDIVAFSCSTPQEAGVKANELRKMNMEVQIFFHHVKEIWEELKNKESVEENWEMI